MNNMERIKAEFEVVVSDFQKSPAMRQILSRDFTLDHYLAILRVLFQHSRENPQIQIAATAYLRGHQQKVVRDFFKQAVSRTGRAKLAIIDLEKLGVNAQDFLAQKQLPGTIALTAYAYHQIRELNPVGYLGYLYFLDIMPHRCAQEYVQALRSLGIPEAAMNFMKTQAAVDISDIKRMANYIEVLMRSQADFDAVAYGMQVTAKLYGSMLQEAMEQVDNSKGYEFVNKEPRTVPHKRELVLN